MRKVSPGSSCADLFPPPTRGPSQKPHFSHVDDLDDRTISSQALLPALRSSAALSAQPVIVVLVLLLLLLLLLRLLLPLCRVVPPENLIITLPSPPPPLSLLRISVVRPRSSYESCLVPSPCRACQWSITCEGYLVSTRTAPRAPTSSRGRSPRAKNSFSRPAKARDPYSYCPSCPRPDGASGYL